MQRCLNACLSTLMRECVNSWRDVGVHNDQEVGWGQRINRARKFHWAWEKTEGAVESTFKIYMPQTQEICSNIVERELVMEGKFQSAFSQGPTSLKEGGLVVGRESGWPRGTWKKARVHVMGKVKEDSTSRNFSPRLCRSLAEALEGGLEDSGQAIGLP